MKSDGTSCEVNEERAWSLDEAAQFANPLLNNFVHCAAHSSTRTVLSIAKVRQKGKLLGVAPLTRVVKYQGTRLLEPGTRRWVDPILGPFMRKTLCMIDASFMAYRHDDPFIARNPADALTVREAVIAYLKSCPDVDSVMISEPAGDPAWLNSSGFSTFLQLPNVRIDIDDCQTLDDYLSRIGRKRRHNIRQERKLFKTAGARLEILAPPIEEGIARELHRCLLASSRRNREMAVPFEDVLTSEAAFVTQHHWVIIAYLGKAIAGFFAFIPHEGVIAQCHGGFDYEYSLPIKAYPNLIHAAVEYGIASGFSEVSLGPLNNEAKRRAGTLAPVMSGFWCRNRVVGLMMDKLIIKRFHIYTGAVT